MVQTHRLYDGASEVTSMGVVMLLKNNANYVRNYLLSGVFDRVSALYPGCHFVYYFCENDSTDDTQQLLQTLAEGKDAHVLCEHIETPYDDYKEADTSYSRTYRIAYIRNYFMDKIKDLPSFSAHSWVLFVDTDIYFDELSIRSMFSYSPTDNNIGMMTCRSISLMKASGSIYTDYHYYDTYAFIDNKDTMYYPRCIMPNCQTCKESKSDDVVKRELIDKSIVDVRSAWGGFVLVNAHVFKHRGIVWKPLNVCANTSLCEHVHFCDALRAVTNTRIVLCMDVECYTDPIECQEHQ